MSRAEIALLLHVLGAILFFSGAAVAAVGHGMALRRRRPADVAVLLGVARAGVPLVALGLVLLVAFGAWLIDLRGHDAGEPWLVASIALLAAALAAGAVGGRRAKRARLEAERLAAGEGAAGRSAELEALVRDRLALALNYASGAAGLAILVLMVWRPGA